MNFRVSTYFLWTGLCLAVSSAACSEGNKFSSCAATRTCPSDSGGAGGDPGSDSGSDTGGSSSEGSGTGGDGGSQNATATHGTTSASSTGGGAGASGSSGGNSDSGGSSASGGSGGSSGNGGSGGSGATGGAATHSGGSTSSGGSSSSEGPELGAPCDEPGALACNGAAQKLRLICDDGGWKNNGSCDANENCEQSSGVCAPIDDHCDDLAAGDRYCDEKAVRECNADQVNSRKVDDCSAACLVVEGQGQCVKVKQVAAGAHTCALLDVGLVRCWGSNAAGELGYGHKENLGDDPGEMPTPNVELGQKAKYIAVGEVAPGGVSHTCAVLEDGAVRCWGYNAAGQLGIGSKETIGDDELPTQDVPLEKKALQVAAGSTFSCALLEGGDVRCWGAITGTSGNQNIGDDPGEYPTENVPLGAPAKEVAAGGLHACAVLETGAVRCWGSGGYGALGIPDSYSIAPEVIPTIDVDLAFPARQVAAGTDISCALVGESGPAGYVSCWGRGLFGALGTGSDKNVGLVEGDMPPLGVPLGTGFNPVAVDVTLYHGCALSGGGSLKCWGSGSSSGYATTDRYGDDPSELPRENVALSGQAVSLSAGNSTTCVILTDGTLQCWGDNSQGAVGLGSPEFFGDDETPADVGLVPVF